MNYKEKIIALLNSQELSKEQKEKLECIFPELKESEDEEIRKWCISHFKGCINVIKDNDEYKEYLSNKVLAWLEKQNNTLDPDKVIEWFRVNWWDSHIGNPIDKFKKDFGL